MINKINIYKEKFPRTYKTLFFLSPFFIYLILSIAYFGPDSLSEMSNSMFNSNSDSQSFVWFLNWLPFSIRHGLNPFFTQYIWSPNGFSLAWSTSIPTLGFIMTPITLTWGALVSFNILVIFSPALMALTTFCLAYYISKKYLAALFGGYIFGFSSYEFGQLQGHTNLDFNFLIPLIVLFFLLRVNKRIGKIFYITVTGIMLAAEFGISNELFATFFLFATMAIILFYLFSKKHTKKSIIAICSETVWAICISLLILSPYLYSMLKNYKDVSSAKNSALTFSADLLNFVIPTPITQIGHNIFSKTSAQFTGNFSEEGSYIGIPFVGILIYVAIKFWNKIYVKVLIILFLIITILNLGPRLHYAGKLTKIYLPWEVGSHLPLIRSALPNRFSLYLFLILALLVSYWLAAKATKMNSSLKYLAVFISILFIVPATTANHWQPISVPKIFQKNTVSSYIKKGTNVVILPYGYLGNSMLYQYSSGMQFTQAGGYAGFIPNYFINSQAVLVFFTGNNDLNFKTDISQFCNTYKVSKIIYTPDTSQNIINSIKNLNWKTQKVGTTIIITVPQA